MPPYLSSPGLLCPRASLYSSQPLQTGVCWWQQDYRTSVCAPAQLHGPWLGVQCDGSPCLASPHLPQAAGISRGPVLCGGVPFSWFHLWAGTLPLHQQQGGPARVSQPKGMSVCVTWGPPGWKLHTCKRLVPTSDLSLPRYTQYTSLPREMISTIKYASILFDTATFEFLCRFGLLSWPQKSWWWRWWFGVSSQVFSTYWCTLSHTCGQNTLNHVYIE